LRRILVPLLVGVLIALLIGVLIRHSTLPPLGFVEIARDSAAYKLWPLTTDLLIVLIQLTTTERQLILATRGVFDGGIVNAKHNSKSTCQTFSFIIK
jgi:hypothetical protein